MDSPHKWPLIWKRLQTMSSQVSRSDWPQGQGVTARFVTRFNLWLRHDLWPHTDCFNLWPGTICDQKCFNLWPALYNDFRVQVVQGKTCFCVYTYNVCNMIWYDAYIYELCYNIYIDSGARSLMLFYINTIWISCMTYTHHISYMCIIFYASFVI